MNKQADIPAKDQDNQSASLNSDQNDGGDELSQRKRYKYCCRKCKHTERGRKSCVCVVPLSQRRTSLGTQGCQTCECKGCSIQDFISRGEDPEYKPKYLHNLKNQQSEKEKEERFDKKNGCCRKCMKAFSKIGKSCICQVPQSVRKTKLTSQGCKICACTGCNPRDHSQSLSSESYEDYRHARQSSRERNRSRDRYSSRSSSPISYDQRQHNFNNVDNSVLGKVIIVEYGLFPGMLGMGIPQRTPSYILGKPS